jgi:hypothetical protein
MSALGHKRTSRHVRFMSALPPKANIVRRELNVRFVPNSGHRAAIDPFSASLDFPAI